MCLWLTNVENLQVNYLLRVLNDDYFGRHDIPTCQRFYWNEITVEHKVANNLISDHCFVKFHLRRVFLTKSMAMRQNYCPGPLIVAGLTLGGNSGHEGAPASNNCGRLDWTTQEGRLLWLQGLTAVNDNVTRWEETRLFAAINLASDCPRFKWLLDGPGRRPSTCAIRVDRWAAHDPWPTILH